MSNLTYDIQALVHNRVEEIMSVYSLPAKIVYRHYDNERDLDELANALGLRIELSNINLGQLFEIELVIRSIEDGRT